jgi:hypothetical protein
MADVGDRQADFSEVTTPAKLEALVRGGGLEKLLLIPPELGGEDNTFNVVYVPVGTAAAKADIDRNVILPMGAAGTAKRYSAMPEYQGDSLVPVAIKIVASEPGEFTTSLNIWGEALRRGGDVSGSPAPGSS